MSEELSGADQWLFDLLNQSEALADALGGEGKIFDTQAPPNTPFPFVVFRNIPTPNVEGAFAARIAHPSLYDVEVITQDASGTSSFAEGKAIALIISGLLQGAVGHSGDTWVQGCTMRRPFKFADTPNDGVTYKHVGATWSLFVYQA